VNRRLATSRAPELLSSFNCKLSSHAHVIEYEAAFSNIHLSSSLEGLLSYITHYDSFCHYSSKGLEFAVATMAPSVCSYSSQLLQHICCPPTGGEKMVNAISEVAVRSY
jgi:hypothetical protein